ncbi:hypothetical protein FIBSPDRAFT_43983 [Athelia psychrophila]|uniref:Secreted protein n=1 Tax=Athelia psychrophila TaxID=1759441 RepID=A0A166U170_9AGAM|nr:hypothetical protein FIBSPDRAFT_43983 [Fibularhizoctonia sp. CBS 109695]
MRYCCRFLLFLLLPPLSSSSVLRRLFFVNGSPGTFMGCPAKPRRVWMPAEYMDGIIFRRNGVTSSECIAVPLRPAILFR